MIDAYTIGIKLALDNGVTEGIAAIRRDLAALDAVVAVSTANVQRLRALAADLPRLAGAGPASSAPSPAAREAPAPPAVLNAAPEPPRAPSTASSPVASPPTSVPRPVTPAAPGPSRPAQAAPSAPMLPSAASAAAPIQSRLDPSLPPIAPVAIRTVAPATKPSPPSQRPSDAPILTIASTTPRAVTASAQTPPSAPTPPRRIAALPAPSRVNLPSAPIWSATASSLGRTAAPLLAKPAKPSAAEQSAKRTSRPKTGDVARQQSAPAKNSAAPVARQTQPGAGEIVAIHVDGRVLGQIMAETLARSASQPTAAATAFDRRMTPAWPANAS